MGLVEINAFSNSNHRRNSPIHPGLKHPPHSLPLPPNARLHKSISYYYYCRAFYPFYFRRYLCRALLFGRSVVRSLTIWASEFVVIFRGGRCFFWFCNFCCVLNDYHNAKRRRRRFHRIAGKKKKREKRIKNSKSQPPNTMPCAQSAVSGRTSDREWAKSLIHCAERRPKPKQKLKITNEINENSFFGKSSMASRRIRMQSMPTQSDIAPYANHRSELFIVSLLCIDFGGKRKKFFFHLWRESTSRQLARQTMTSWLDGNWQPKLYFSSLRRRTCSGFRIWNSNRLGDGFTGLGFRCEF